MLNYTIEMNRTLLYTKEVLFEEFPNFRITPEYLLLGILDNENTHGCQIVQEFVTLEELEQLKYTITENIQKNTKQPFLDVGRFDCFSVKVIGMAQMEAVNLKSGVIGTEHLLLSLLNPENKCLFLNLLSEYGMNYKNIYSMVSDSYYIEENGEKGIKKNISMAQRIPLKSEINKKAVVQMGNSPFIQKYTTNLQDKIRKKKYDKLIGRNDILSNIIKVLSRRRKNNVILVGKPGVGKTSIAYRLAEMIEDGEVPELLKHKQVIMLDSMALISGTQLRGMFEERVNGLLKELKDNPNYILFIDDMQSVIKSSSKDRDSDLSDFIGTVLSEGDVQVVATISFKSYRNGIESNPVLSTKLQKIVIEPSSKEETFEILKETKKYYEKFHHVKFSDDTIKLAIKLAKRYITNNCLPDSAIDVIDLVGASLSTKSKQSKILTGLKEKASSFDEEKKEAMSSGDFELLDNIAKKESALQKDIADAEKNFDKKEETWLEVKESDITATVSEMTSIPISKLNASNKTTILHIEDILKKDIIGQDEAIRDVAKAIKRNRAGFADNNKCTTFLEIGPTGCGKTALAKKLALNVYGSENALIRFDMSEYQDKTSVNKLLGSSAGYVGYENGGLLTEAIKNKPYCVLLFDEIEKADESIYNVFLQLFDEGRLTDNNGVTVNFKNVIVIMTSNVGARQSAEYGNGIGFQVNSNDDVKKSIVEKSLKSKFNPEFLNRIDKIIHFNSLTDENLKEISKIELNKLIDRVKENHVILECDNSVVDYIYKKAILQKEYGARPIMRIIQDNISDKVVDYVLASESKENKYKVKVENDEVEVEKVAI